MWKALVLFAFLVQSPTVSVQTIDGNAQRGTIEKIDGNSFSLSVDGNSVDLALDQLQSVTVTGKSIVPLKGAIDRIHLIDGSIILSSPTSLQNGILSGQRGDIPFKIAAADISHILFLQITPELQPFLDDILKLEASSDMLMVRKPSGALDPLEGVIKQFDDTQVAFDFDGTDLDVARTKLGGVRLARARTSELAKRLCTVKDIHGNEFSCQAISTDDTSLKMVLAVGAELEIPLSDVARLEFKSSNLAYLSDLTPENIKWTPYLSIGEVSPQLEQLYLPRFNESYGKQPLILGNDQFTKGIALHSRTEISFRLSENYKVFQAVAGIDPRSRDHGHVELVIIGDNKQLYRKEIAGQQSDELTQIEFSIDGIRRLRIIVDYGENLDIGDQLILGNARIIK